MRKQWKSVGLKPPVNPRVFVELPTMPCDDLIIYWDRKTGIFWREDVCNGPSTWSFYRPPPLKKKKIGDTHGQG